MSEIFKKILLKTRNKYPFLFYKSKGMEIGNLNFENELSYKYFYDPQKISVYVNNIFNNIFNDFEKYNMIYYTLYNNNNNTNHEINKTISHIITNNMDDKSMLIVFIPGKYEINTSKIDNFIISTLEDYKILFYFRNIESLNSINDLIF